MGSGLQACAHLKGCFFLSSTALASFLQLRTMGIPFGGSGMAPLFYCQILGFRFCSHISAYGMEQHGAFFMKVW